MNYTDYSKQNRPGAQTRWWSKSGRVCAVLDESGSNWVFPLYRHPGPYATPPELHAAHQSRCVPVQCVDQAAELLERIDVAVYGIPKGGAA